MTIVFETLFKHVKKKKNNKKTNKLVKHQPM